MSGSAFSATKKLNAKLPFGDCVKANTARQSCSSRCRLPTLLAKLLRTRSYVVFHCAAHFCVRWNDVFACSDCVGGCRKIAPPYVVTPVGVVPAGGAVFACAIHSS